jgi:hypothetical protein
MAAAVGFSLWWLFSSTLANSATAQPPDESVAERSLGLQWQQLSRRSALDNLNPKLARFCEILNQIFSRHHLSPFEMTGMLFAPDVTGTNYKPPGLLLERKTGVPFTANRFWSKAPFHYQRSPTRFGGMGQNARQRTGGN